MKGQVFVEIVLICILGIYGWRLADGLLHPGAAAEQVAVDDNKRLLFVDATGIDVLGQRVSPARLPGTKRVMVFLLRNVSLSSDREFWNNVGSFFPKGGDVQLVGYCDGSACVEAVRNDPRSVDFPVIIYGEVTDSQAMLNADAEGDFVLMENGKQPRTIRWRSTGLTPASVIRSVLQ